MYPGTCRAGLAGKPARAWRLRSDEGCGAAVQVDWVDRRLGPQQQDVTHAVGDFVLRRADGLWAYQLAVVVDDGAQLYWLNGLRIMQTSRQTRQTKLLSDKGALAMAIHAGAVFTFNHNNERKLLRIDTGSGQVSELATLPFVANTLHADANGVWLLTAALWVESRLPAVPLPTLVSP